MSFKKLVSSSIFTVVLCTAASAQETKPGQATSPRQASANQEANKTSSHGMVTPEHLAACWALDNQEEIILAKFAQDQTKNKDVTAFAKMIAEEHQACLKKLSKYAPEASREGYLVENQADQSRARSDSKSTATTEQTKTPGAVVTTNPNANAGENSTAGVDMLQLQREIAQQCISDSKKYLSSKEGDDFDQTFIGMQIGKHAAMRTKLVVLQRHTSDQMQQMVTEGIQATEKHMKAAEDLMAKLEGADPTLTTKNSK